LPGNQSIFLTNLSLCIGAKFYYLRNILHDWPDDKAVIILKNLIPALSPDSRILIDDLVLPNEKVHWQAAQIDLTMMSALGSKERTEEQWHALIDAAGLQILNIIQYTTPLGDSIIVAVPK
jgi:demethylsterigmatocystin 6-O-methyltransferase